MNKMNNRERIGKRIAQIRMEAGISQYKLAELTGLAPGNIARIETGKYSTGIDILSKIGDALGYQLDFIENK
jgi:transcriptional regulator with XRE-family HTH domain